MSNIETTSGESYIYGIANVAANELGGANIKDALDKVNTIEDLKKIQATLSSTKNIDRIGDNLVMSGTYKSGDTSTETDGKCIIPTADTPLTGTIYLKRLDSHISFKIKIDNEDINSFKFNSWQVFNVPVKSNLILQETDAVGASKEDYVDSALQNQFTTDKEDSKTFTFSFYMLENRKNAKEGISSNEYIKRELEVKQADGKNHELPQYQYADQYATYVEIKGVLQFKKTDDNGKTYYRYANVCYNVHLGYVGNDATDFKSERNKKYTYNMTIKDVENIILEVTNGTENQPGAEGDIVDAKTKIYELDAHYHCFNIGFTGEEISKFTFRVKTPFGEINQNSTDSERQAGDYQWIKFIRTEKYNNLAIYKLANVIDLFNLKQDMDKRGATSTSKTKYYYTVFIDEYFYDNAPGNNTWDSPYWKHFVNKENREALILLTPKTSTDGNSSYADAEYLITQKSIQTYYSTTDFNETRTALGIEHVNEVNDTKNIPDMTSDLNKEPDWDENNGAWNTWKYIDKKDKTWTTYCNPTSANSQYYTFSMKEVKAWAECLSRNRDENSNGKIDKEELKWYMPTNNQLASVFLGAPSLPNPIFDANAITAISDQEQYHYATSNKMVVWSEEGCSFSGTEYSYNTLRCVRNLGQENGTTKKENIVSPAYTYDNNTRTFTMKMDEKNVRAGIIEEAEIPSHDNFSQNNRPYHKFQVAKNFINDKNRGSNWSEDFLLPSGKSVCTGYTENSDQSDRGSWRAPNQRELLIMYAQDPKLVIKTNNNVKQGSYSCSHWKYDTTRQFGLNTGEKGDYTTPVLYLDNGYSWSPCTIRCIRDVK